MKKFMSALCCVLFCQSSLAFEVFSIDMSLSLETQILGSCPWITLSDVQQITVAEPEKIGWSGGDGSQILGGLFEATGIEGNHTTVQGDLPENTMALFFNTQYFNNEGGAKILVSELGLVDTAGHKVTVSLTESDRVLEQTLGHTGESLLVCFNDKEEFVHVFAKLTHQNVDGSRPRVGITALTE